jgi:3-hydroxyacyl-[acyl-carrier-protein] dehydratase
MKTFHHDLMRVEDYLHHRSPYLLVDSIDSLNENEVFTSTKITGDEFFMAGHFPGAPILPGAMMQEMTTQSAGILIAARHNPMEQFNTHDPFFNEYALGVLVKVHRARYRNFARPGDELKIHVRLVDTAGSIFDFSARITRGGEELMQNSFRLANIPSSVLQGREEETGTVG